VICDSCLGLFCDACHTPISRLVSRHTQDTASVFSKDIHVSLSEVYCGRCKLPYELYCAILPMLSWISYRVRLRENAGAPFREGSSMQKRALGTSCFYNWRMHGHRMQFWCHSTFLRSIKKFLYCREPHLHGFITTTLNYFFCCLTILYFL